MDKNAVELKKWKGDNLHIDSEIQKLDGFQKTYNYIVSERESGKSSLMWKKIYNAFKNEKRPSIVLKRYQADISDTYLSDVESLINKFTESNIEFNYSKAELRTGGQLDLKINEEVFCRIIALNTPLSRLKSMFLANVKYMMCDEFICNKRLGEKYLPDEPFRVKEVYNTYNRETNSIKIYYWGNPYSLFNPYFSDKNIDTNKLYPGALLAENDYCVWCYQIKPELKAKILERNPLYKFDEAYKKYAFDGRAIQDSEIRIINRQPENFCLDMVMKLHGKYIGIYRGYQYEPERLHYWCQLLEKDVISKRRDILCFDFGEMASRTVLFSTNTGRTKYYSLKECIEKRWIAFKSIEESWLIEEIYQEI